MIYICIPTTKERRSRLQECVTAIKDNANYNNYSIITYENYREGCQVAVIKMISGLGNSLTLVLNDDMIVQKDFLKNAFEEYTKAFPNNDGLGSLNENNMYKEIAIIQFAPASLLYKYLYDGYKHYYADMEIAEVFGTKGKYLPIENAVVEHNHHFYNEIKRPDLLDDTYDYSNKTYWVHDNDIYKDRRSKSDNYKNLAVLGLD